MSRKIENDLIKKAAAQEVLSSVKPLGWFIEATKTRNASSLRDEAPFVSLSTAERLVNEAQTLSPSHSWNALRAYASKFLASLEDATWGGRYAN
jgi:hypothetical protein